MIKGVPAWDGDSKERFTLRAYLCLVSADRVGMQKITALAGPNGKRPCPYCSIKGIWSTQNKHYYYPLMPPVDRMSDEVPRAEYDPLKLPMRRKFRDLIRKVISADSENLRKESGVSGLSILYELPTVFFSQSFCVDSMHLVLENTMSHLYRLWTGTIPFGFNLIVRGICEEGRSSTRLCLIHSTMGSDR